MLAFYKENTQSKHTISPKCCGIIMWSMDNGNDGGYSEWDDDEKYDDDEQHEKCDDDEQCNDDEQWDDDAMKLLITLFYFI